jgi:hypothetical protein
MKRKESPAVKAGKGFLELGPLDPDIVRQWNDSKDKIRYSWKGTAFHIRHILQRHAQRWRDEVGTEPPDLTSLEELESLASAIGIPFETWGKFTAGEIFELALEHFKTLTPNEARAKFCFEAWQSGKSLKEINVLLRRHPEWEHYSNDRGVRRAIDTWSKRIGVKPRKGQPGRRPK